MNGNVSSASLHVGLVLELQWGPALSVIVPLPCSIAMPQCQTLAALLALLQRDEVIRPTLNIDS